MYREDQENRPIASFTSKNIDSQSPFSKGRVSELDSDPNSVSMIRELLNSDGEWTGVPEILKLTMTAFYKIMESHSNTIKEMENALIMKSNKVDVHNLMSSKVNLKDFRQTVSDISQDIETRVSLDQVKQIVES